MRNHPQGVIALSACAILLLAAQTDAQPTDRRASRILVRGKVTAIESGEPLADARVRIKGLRHATARSNGRGRYRIRVPADTAGVFPVLVRGAGRWKRHSWIRIESEARRVRADWSLIPRRRNRFHLAFFDSVTRLSYGTTRWQQPPTFRILDTRLECIDGTSSQSCPEWIASTSSPLPKVKEWLVHAVETARVLSGGFLDDSELEIVALAPGTHVKMDELLEPGVFTLGEVTPGHLGIELPRLTPGTPIETYLHLLRPEFALTRWVAVRFVAEGIGYAFNYQPRELCDQLRDLGVRSVLCSTHGISDATDFDAVLGSVLYGRPVGNRSPDRDPEPDPEG